MAGFDSSLLKKVEDAPAPQTREVDLGKARAQFVALEQGLSKQHRTLTQEATDLRQALANKEQELREVTEQLAKAVEGRKSLDVPTEEQEHVAMLQQHHKVEEIRVRSRRCVV